jgi:hypothetical protein
MPLSREERKNLNRRRHECPGCGKRTSAALCNACRPSKAQRPERKCLGCPRMTTAMAGLCQKCKRADAVDQVKWNRPAQPHEVLADGSWVTGRGGVKRWVPNQTTEVA